MKKKLLFGSILGGVVLGLLFFWAFLQKESLPSPGIVTGIYGTKIFLKNTPLKLGDQIRLGQKIITGENSSVELTFDSQDSKSRKTVINIYENSEFIVESTFLTPQNKFLAKLIKGYIKSVIQNLLPEDTHKIISPNAITGVRGTRYYIQFLPEEETTKVHVLDVSSQRKVTAAVKGQPEVEVPPQKTAVIIKNQAPILKDLDPSELPKEPPYQRSEEKTACLETQGEMTLKGKVRDSDTHTPIADATVIGFVDYWSAPPPKIKERKARVEELKKGGSTYLQKLKEYYELYMGLKEWGTRCSGSQKEWKVKTQSDGTFEITGLPHFNEETMFDIRYDVVAYKSGYGEPHTLWYTSKHTISFDDIAPPIYEYDKKRRDEKFSTLDLPLLKPRYLNMTPGINFIEEEQWSGSRFVQNSVHIQYTIYKMTLSSDEVILPDNLPRVQGYFPNMGNEKNRAYFRAETQRLRSNIKSSRIIAGMPLMGNSGHWNNIAIGYDFEEELKNYLIIKYQDTAFSHPMARLTTGLVDVYHVGPPFLKSHTYFEKLKEEIEIPEKFIPAK
ncbi:MAG: hypothetical protein HYY61_01370 [Deltaproteobacteria bacterium]|nr:hypothetical protein [Deltaproteobacteria bacterium]